MIFNPFLPEVHLNIAIALVDTMNLQAEATFMAFSASHRSFA
jgi:hypothetical protein